jgi:hypothetical protein
MTSLSASASSETIVRVDVGRPTNCAYIYCKCLCLALNREETRTDISISYQEACIFIENIFHIAMYVITRPTKLFNSVLKLYHFIINLCNEASKNNTYIKCLS